MDLLSLIAAVAENGVLGAAGRLPWHLRADLRRFKKLTMGHHLIMGRKTYESINRLLPGRTTIIVSRRLDYRVPGATVVASLPEARAAAAGDNEVFVVGGGEIYQQALPLVDRLYLTVVHAAPPGDTFFPAVDWSRWELLSDQSFPADAWNDHPYSFRVFHRRDVTKATAKG